MEEIASAVALDYCGDAGKREGREPFRSECDIEGMFPIQVGEYEEEHVVWKIKELHVMVAGVSSRSVPVPK